MDSKSDIVILYDGYCKLCNFSLQFSMKRDKREAFQYYPLQSNEAKDLVSEYFSDVNFPDSVILIDGGVLYTKSAAFFKILPYLGKGYKLFYVFKILPQKIADKVYDWIAKNRYSWFGQKNECGLTDINDE